MENTLKIKLNTEQIISLLHQLDADERMEILKEFSEEWLALLGISSLESITIEEYNQKLEQGLKDFKEGNVLSHQQMKAEVERWKKRKV